MVQDLDLDGGDMKKVLFSFLILLCGLLLNACATLKVDRPALAKVKKVAIVGFTVEQEELEGFVLFKKGERKGPGWAVTSSLATENPVADKLMMALAQQLQKSFKWNVTDTQSLRNVQAYSQFLHDKTTGIQMTPPGAVGYVYFRPAGIVASYPVERLSTDERIEMAKKLGVDAIATAAVRVNFEKGGGLKQLVGAGTYYPFATMRFTVYTKNGGEVVWQDFNAQGKDTVGSDHVLGITETSDVDKGVLEAARAAYKTLIKRNQEST